MACVWFIHIRKCSGICVPNWLTVTFIAVYLSTACTASDSYNSAGDRFYVSFPPVEKNATPNVLMQINIISMEVFPTEVRLSILASNRHSEPIKTVTIEANEAYTFDYKYHSLNKSTDEISSLEVRTNQAVTVSVVVNSTSSQQPCWGLYNVLPVRTWHKMYIPHYQRAPCYAIFFTMKFTMVERNNQEGVTINSYSVNRKTPRLVIFEEIPLGFFSSYHIFGLLYGSFAPGKFSAVMPLPAPMSIWDYIVPVFPVVEKDTRVSLGVSSAKDGVVITIMYNNSKTGELFKTRGSYMEYNLTSPAKGGKLSSCSAVRVSAENVDFVVSLIRTYSDGERFAIQQIPVPAYRTGYLFRTLQNFSSFHLQMVSDHDHHYEVVPQSLKNSAKIHKYSYSELNIFAVEWKVNYPDYTIVGVQAAICTYRFGLYIIYYQPSRETTYSPGFNILLDHGNCKNRIAIKEDYRDNDCDGLHDEEVFDGIDNDEDGLIDEDFCVNISATGNFTEWGQWGNCDLVKCRYTRQRECKNPFPGAMGTPCNPAVFEDVGVLDLGNCSGQNLTCPYDCPNETYSTLCTPCSKDCLHCEQINGMCLLCGHGQFRDLMECTECPGQTFGFNCESNCDPDCLDVCSSITGDCTMPTTVRSIYTDIPTTPYVAKLPELKEVSLVGPVILSLIALAGLVYLICAKTKKQTSELPAVRSEQASDSLTIEELSSQA